MRVSTSDRLHEYMEKYSLRQTDILIKCQPYCRKHEIPVLTKSVLSRYVSGERKPTADNLLMLAEVLNVSEAWLAGYDVPMDRKSAEAMQADTAIALADAAKDPDFSSCLCKIRELSPNGKTKVYGYVDAIHDLEHQKF